MANLLTIEKRANGYFRFVLNGDTANFVDNIMNWLTIVANKCHFKTRTGANVIKEQDIVFGNITLIDGVTTIIPISNDDLIDQLTALGFFDWVFGSGGGVDRFTDLLDTFDFTGQGNKMVVVNAAETQLQAIPVVNAINSTDLLDMPPSIAPNQLLIGKNDGTKYIIINPLDLPISTATLAAINGVSPQPLEFLDYPLLVADGVQDFTLPIGRTAKVVMINGYPQSLLTDNNALETNTYTQVGDIVTLTQPTFINNYISMLIQ